MKYSYERAKKTLQKKEKMPVRSIFSISNKFWKVSFLNPFPNNKF